MLKFYKKIKKEKRRNKLYLVFLKRIIMFGIFRE